MTSRRWDGDNDMSSPVAARWVATGLFRQDLSSTRVFVYELCERSIILWSLARRLTGRGATSAMYDCILTIKYNSQLKQVPVLHLHSSTHPISIRENGGRLPQSHCLRPLD